VALNAGSTDEEEEQYMKNARGTIRFISAIIVDCLDRKYWTQYELHQEHEECIQNAKAQKS